MADEGKRIYELDQLLALVNNYSIAVDRVGNPEALRITLLQLINWLSTHAPVTLADPHNGLYLVNQLLGLAIVSTLSPGACPTLPNNADVYLNGAGLWTTPPGGSGGGGEVEVIKEIPTGAVNGVNTQFVLSQTANNISMTYVYVNGVYRTDYTYDVGTKTITLEFAPATGQVVEVHYFRTIIPSAEFDATNFELTFARKPTGNSYSTITKVDNLTTKIEHFSDVTKTVKIFTTDITRIGSEVTTMVTTDEVTGKVLTVTINRAGGVITGIDEEVV